MNLECKNCEKEVEAEINEMPKDSLHYGKAVCPDCGRFLQWIKKPENEGKRTKSKYTPEKLGVEYCEICGRDRNRLGYRETLDIHHKIP
ncbi:unnamed protein product, partial [marine sediment metagenome]